MIEEIYKMVVRYEREGDIYYDEYQYRRSTLNQAIHDMKRDWHSHNDHLFNKAKQAEFYVLLKRGTK